MVAYQNFSAVAAASHHALVRIGMSVNLQTIGVKQNWVFGISRGVAIFWGRFLAWVKNPESQFDSLNFFWRIFLP
jgi:hypothetical protein